MQNSNPALHNRPVRGICTTVKPISVYDADTITVQVTKIIQVRLLSSYGYFDTPEIRSKDPDEKARAIRLRNRLRQLLAENTSWVAVADEEPEYKEIDIFIPASDRGQIKDVLTMTRVLAHVYADDKNVADIIWDEEQGKLKARTK